MKRIIGVALVAALLSIGGTAFAQKRAGKVKVKKPEKTIVVDDSDKVIGTITRPDDGPITGVKDGVNPTMIRYRETMVDRMIKSADDVS